MRELKFLLVAWFIAFGCSMQEKGYVINGHIDGVEDSAKVYLIDLNGSRGWFDSTFCVGGDFSFKGSVETPMVCRVKCKGEAGIIYLENTEISFRSPYKNMYYECVVKGGREQEEANKVDALLKSKRTVWRRYLDSLVTKKYLNKDHRKKLADKYNSLFSEIESVRRDFAENNPNSMESLQVMHVYRNLYNRDTLKAVFSRLDSEHKESFFAKSLRVYLEKPLAKVGSKCIDFEARTLKGESFKLSSLEGKYVLLVFVDPSCGYCSLMHKAIRESLAELPEDLEVVSFNKEINEEYWRASSVRDSVSWHYVRDTADFYNVATQYGVVGVPHSCLIGKDGKVLRFEAYSPDVMSVVVKEIEKQEIGGAPCAARL
ncbi:MAG: AhpC/TSA family protein [Cytophagales bacterium]|nr:AhpC/TSA family protein [Cytophagales bacterium]